MELVNFICVVQYWLIEEEEEYETEGDDNDYKNIYK